MSQGRFGRELGRRREGRPGEVFLGPLTGGGGGGGGGPDFTCRF